ncbi:nucleotidyltransferase [bacterium]|nr:nucleotidyltransferase [bacterium]
MAQPTLLVMAAGIGSRYGGLKQIEPVGPGGETIIDYSVYDSIRAGFGKLVFVIRHDIEEAFREIVGRRFEDKIDVRYVFQELDSLPAGFSVPEVRKKPWGTGHAVLVAEEEVREPFAVINGDDFYGAESFRALGDYLRNAPHARDANEPEEYAMVGFTLRQTLSEFGHVARGICSANERGFLEELVETTHIEKEGDGARVVGESGELRRLTGAETVSMNMWGFTPTLFEHLREQFEVFLEGQVADPKAEFFLPSVINRLMEQGKAQIRILPTGDSWFGVTYREDKSSVDESIRCLIAQKVYAPKLWA